LEIGSGELRSSTKEPNTDFLRLALIHSEEVTKLLGEHDELFWRMETEMEVVAEPVRPASQRTGGVEEDDDEETTDEQAPSILNVLNED
jgi:hypothetical protein